jgi:protein-L-isoaspartate(D-aspartate) O-methyltransferase
MASSESDSGENLSNSVPEATTGQAAPGPVELRQRLVNYLLAEGAIRSPLLAKAFSEVPREIFLPASVPIERVYSDDAIVVKWDENNYPSSSSSQPILMADMLEALRLEPGLKVLEIGAGVGYNAALMAGWAGDGSLVTTIDLDPAMADIARNNLSNLARLSGKNFDRVTVVAGDGSLGYPPNAPYDRVIVTVQQWEIAPAWVEQLRVGGILLLPLTVSNHLWGGLIPALQKQPDGTLVGIGGSFGGFMPMRGEMAHPAVSQGRFVLLPLSPDQLWPDRNTPEETASKLLLSNSETLPGLEKFLEQPGVEVSGPEENFILEFAGKNDQNRGQRDGSYAFFGFSFVLALVCGDMLFSLYVATPLPETVDGQPTLPNGRTHTGWVRDGWQYENRGLALVEISPDGCGYDLALLLSPNRNNQPDKQVQGWRLRPPNAAPPSLVTPNRAIEKLRQAWQTWQSMGRPNPAQYRPVAFPADRLQPVPGLELPRRFYNLVLPFQP